MRVLVVLAFAAAAMALPAQAAADVPVNTGPPSIIADPPNTAYIGYTLYAMHSAWTVSPPGPITIAPQWLSCDAAGAGCVPIAGATSNNYTVQRGDAGHTFRLQEIATSGSDVSAPAVSAPSAVVPVPDPPPAPLTGLVKVTGPSITGTPQLGGTLTAQNGTWTGTAPIAFSYQWLRCHPRCRQIHGATAQTYTVTKADAVTYPDGRQTVLSVYVGATNPFSAILTLVNPGVEIIAPRMLPKTVGNALIDATYVAGPDGEIPQLLAHNGYTAHYYVMQSGRVTITWRRSDMGPLLASGHAVFGRRARGWHTFRVRLTQRGRRLLAHTQQVEISDTVELLPLHGLGGNSTTGQLLLSRDNIMEVT